jgi:hypothetical protein
LLAQPAAFTISVKRFGLLSVIQLHSRAELEATPQIRGMDSQ